MATFFRNSRAEQAQRRKNTRFFGVVAALAILLGFIVSGARDEKSETDTKKPERIVELVSDTAGPKSGTEFFRKYERNPAVLHIENKSSADVYARCADALFNNSVLNFYLKAGEEIDIAVPVGYFELHVAAGESWLNEQELFGETTVFLGDTLQNGLEFSRKKTCEFTIEAGFSNMQELSENEF